MKPYGNLLGRALEHSANSPLHILNDPLDVQVEGNRCAAWWRGSNDLNVSVGDHAITDHVEGESYGVLRILTELAGWTDEQARSALLERAGLSSSSTALPPPRVQSNKPKAKPVRKAADALDQWQKLSSSGTSAYLVRKGVQRASHITDQGDLEPVTVQRISDKPGAKKLFAKDATAQGVCTLIGADSLKTALATGHVFLAEGVATALTIHEATGDAVLACFSASGLKHVAKALRALKSSAKLRITVAADNDQYHTLDKGNPGLEAAHQTALTYRCVVCSPMFANHEGRPTDFNDLHLLEGLEQLKQQLAQPANPDSALAYAVDRRQLERRLERKQAGRGRYLKPLTLHPGVTLLRAPHGTGKTEQLKPHIDTTLESRGRVLYITPSAALTDSSARRLGLESYADKLHYDHLREIPGVAICLNSLPRLLDGAGNLPAYDLVILDESEQLTRALTGKHITNRERVLETLILLLQRAPRVVCLDADLGQLTRTLLEQARPHGPFHWLEHFHPVGQGRTIRLHEQRDDLYATLADCREPVFVVTNSKTEAEAIGAYLSDLGKRARVLTGDHDEDSAKFMSDIDHHAEVENLEVLVCSPTVRTGVSLTAGYFKHVFGIFSSLVGTPEDALQALWRVRTPASYDVWLDPRMTREHVDLTARYGATREHEATRLGRRVGTEKPTYRAIKLAVEHYEQQAQAAFKLRFLKRAALQGFAFDMPATNPLHRGLAKSARERAEGVRRARITAARALDSCEAKVLEKRKNLTRDDRDALERHHVTGFYRLTATDDLTATLELDHRGRYRRQLEQLERVFLSDEGLQNHMDDLLEKHTLADDLPLLASRREVWRRVLRAVGFENAVDLVRKGDTKQLALPRYTLASLEQLRQWIENERGWLSGLIALPDTETLRTNLIRHVGAWLKGLGLKQKRVGDNGLRTYALELGALETTCSTMKKRQTLSLIKTIQEKSVCEPLKDPQAAATWLRELLEPLGQQKTQLIRQKLDKNETTWLGQLATSRDLQQILRLSQ